MLCTLMKHTVLSVSAPKEEKEEEEEVSGTLGHGSPVGTARPSRSWRSSRAAAAARQRDPENARASRAKAASLQLICKSEPNADQLEYGTCHGRAGDSQGWGCHSGRVAVLAWCCLSRVPSATSTPGSECRRRYRETDELTAANTL